ANRPSDTLADWQYFQGLRLFSPTAPKCRKTAKQVCDTLARAQIRRTFSRGETVAARLRRCPETEIPNLLPHLKMS
ncbi:MAG: hypothetical protein ABSA59_16240, partial [Terriglobia bacterium]